MTKLEKARREAGLSRGQLSKKSKVGVKSIESYEQGFNKINNAKFLNILRLSIALNSPVSSILNEDEGETIELFKIAKERGLLK